MVGAGRLATVARTNPGLVAGATTTYGYDNADRVTGLTTVQGAATIGEFAYTYGRSGQVTQATELVDGTTRAVGYTYDGLGRVSGSTVAFGAGGTTTYAYTNDNVGNRTSVSVNGVATQARSYDATDQVVGWTYDGAGNLTGDGARTYTWNPLGRLVGTTGGGTTTTYAYTGDGHLLSEESGTTSTQYVLDTANGLVERLGMVTLPSGGVATSAWYARGLGGELSREQGGGGGLAWYLADRLGSVRAEYSSAGTSSLRVDYDPVGVPESGTSLGAPTDYGFAGESQESATGLVQLRARWYQPMSGQFVSRDPWAGDAGTPQTYNPYAYAHNDPTNGLDPSGLWRIELGTLAGGMTASGLDALPAHPEAQSTPDPLAVSVEIPCPELAPQTPVTAGGAGDAVPSLAGGFPGSRCNDDPWLEYKYVPANESCEAAIRTLAKYYAVYVDRNYYNNWSPTELWRVVEALADWLRAARWSPDHFKRATDNYTSLERRADGGSGYESFSRIELYDGVFSETGGGVVTIVHEFAHRWDEASAAYWGLSHDLVTFTGGWHRLSCLPDEKCNSISMEVHAMSRPLPRRDPSSGGISSRGAAALVVLLLLVGCARVRDPGIPAATRTAPSTIPAYPNGQEVKRTSRGGQVQGFPTDRVTIQTTDSLAQVVAYYRALLVPLGWVAVDGSSLVNDQACPIYTLGFQYVGEHIEIELFGESCLRR
jgi:RHS repeat-associated protein